MSFRSITLLLFTVLVSFSMVGANEARIKELEKKVRLLEARVKALESRPQSSATAKSTASSTTAPLNTSGLITARLLKKKLDVSNGQNLALLISFSNNSFKGIAGFRGELFFTSNTGEKLLNFAVDVNKVIPRSGEMSWYGGIDYVASEVGQVKLLNMHHTQVRVTVKLDAVYYTDGTSKTFN